MDLLTEAGKALVPGSFPLLVLTATVATALLFSQRPAGRVRRIARLLIALTVAWYWLSSIPAIAHRVQQGFPPLTTLPAAGPNTAIVVLGAGIETYIANGGQVDVAMSQSAFNVLQGAELYRALREPWVIVSGGMGEGGEQQPREADVMAVLLRERGVRDDRLILERQSYSTYTQAIEVARLAKSRSFDRLIVVSAPAHLRRAIPAFRAQGVDAVGYQASFSSVGRIVRSPWLPNGEAFGIARDALYDYIGWGYYWARGWLSAR